MNLELLRQVCVTPGAPGFEDKIRDFIIQEVAPLVDAVRVDNMGSVIAIVEGNVFCVRSVYHEKHGKNHDGRRPHG